LASFDGPAFDDPGSDRKPDNWYYCL